MLGVVQIRRRNQISIESFRESVAFSFCTGTDRLSVITSNYTKETPNTITTTTTFNQIYLITYQVREMFRP